MVLLLKKLFKTQNQSYRLEYISYPSSDISILLLVFLHVCGHLNLSFFEGITYYAPLHWHDWEIQWYFIFILTINFYNIDSAIGLCEHHNLGPAIVTSIGWIRWAYNVVAFFFFLKSFVFRFRKWLVHQNNYVWAPIAKHTSYVVHLGLHLGMGPEGSRDVPHLSVYGDGSSNHHSSRLINDRQVFIVQNECKLMQSPSLFGCVLNSGAVVIRDSCLIVYLDGSYDVPH